MAYSHRINNSRSASVAKHFVSLHKINFKKYMLVTTTKVFNILEIITKELTYKEMRLADFYLSCYFC